MNISMPSFVDSTQPENELKVLKSQTKSQEQSTVDLKQLRAL